MFNGWFVDHQTRAIAIGDNVITPMLKRSSAQALRLGCLLYRVRQPGGPVIDAERIQQAMSIVDCLFAETERFHQGDGDLIDQLMDRIRRLGGEVNWERLRAKGRGKGPALWRGGVQPPRERRGRAGENQAAVLAPITTATFCYGFVADQNAAVTKACDVTATTPHASGITPSAGAWWRGGTDGINCTTWDVTRPQSVAVRGSWHTTTTLMETMTTINKTNVDPRSETLFAKRCFLAAHIVELQAKALELEGVVEGLEATVHEFELEDEEAEKSAKYLGGSRWEYRNSHIEGMWVMPIGEYEFLAITDLHEHQFQKFSQARTWLDGVDAGIQEYIDLTQKRAQ